MVTTVAANVGYKYSAKNPRLPLLNSGSTYSIPAVAQTDSWNPMSTIYSGL
jgi:hypothetical protein